MDPLVAEKLVRVLQTAAIAGLFFAACAVWPKIKRRYYLSKLPTLDEFGSGETYRKTFLREAKKVFARGYEKYPDRAYTIPGDTGHPCIVIPPNLLQEIRKLPDDVVSVSAALTEIVEVKYTRIVVDSHIAISTIKGDLTPALNRLNPTISQDVDAALREYIPTCDDWTEIKFYERIVPLVAKVSGRLFIGPEDSKNPAYLDAACNYTLHLTDAITALKKMSPWQKTLWGHRIPEVLKLRECEKKIQDIVGPLVSQRLESMAKDPNWKAPDDMLQWMLNKANGKVDVEQLSYVQLSLIFGAIHTTSMTATIILYQLAATPEYIEPLREEIRNALEDNDGIITTRTLSQMAKVDSFMKEVIRFSPPTVSSFFRYVKKGIKLNNGQYIPEGVMIESPSMEIYLDDKFYPSSKTFDGFRSYKLRGSGKAQDIARNQFVTSNETNLTFGYGNHACPGRFFAANEIKMVLVRLLLQYDIKMPEGVTERYPNLEIGKQVIPDMSGVLLFKRVQA